MGKVFSLFGDDSSEQFAREQAQESRAAEERAREDTTRRAEEDRAREDERKAAIKRTVGNVNSQFSKFNDAHYGNIIDAYEKFYLPQVEEQARATRRSLILNPAGGTGQSSAQASRLGEFERDAERARINVRNEALDSANTQRSNVENNRSRLLASAEAGESFDSMQPRTTEVIRSLAAPTAYSPIADLFARYVAGAANVALGNSQAPRSPTPLIFSRTRGAERTVT